MKNILVVCEAMGVNGTSAGIVSSTFIKLLHESGHKVTVITRTNFDGDAVWLPKEIIIKKYNLSVERKTFIDKIPKVKAIPIYVTGFTNSVRYNKQLYKNILAKELKENQYDLIYALAAGDSFVPYFALSEMKLDIPYFVNIHDPYPKHIYPEPYKLPKNHINSILERKFRKVLDKAKGISFPSQFLMEDMANTFSMISSKGFVIPHIGTLLPHLPKEAGDDFEALDRSKINIIHAGTLLGPRNPKFLLKAIAALNEEHTDFLNKVSFTFIGAVNKSLKDIIANSALQNVRFITTRLSYQKSLDLIAQSDASFVIEAIADFSPFLPGKVADIAFAEKPIIDLSPKNSEVRRLLGPAYPYQCELDDVEAIKVVLKQFYNDHINSTIKIDSIIKLKQYLSIEHNSKIVNKHFN